MGLYNKRSGGRTWFGIQCKKGFISKPEMMRCTTAARRDNGILNGTSTVSGIGINPALADPTVNSGANATGSGTIVLSAAQTLEDGITLTFSGAGKTATITGEIEILKAGTASATLRFDVEKLLTSG